MTTPNLEKKKGISPVWILPLLAICIGGWLLYRHITTAGIDIVVSFKDATGITPGKTPVLFKGNQVGRVKAISLQKDLQGIDLTIEMDRRTAPYLVKDLKFWVEKVEVGADRITGLQTLLSGSFIGVQPGVSTQPARAFVGLPSRPPVPENAPGLHLFLKADALYSLQLGSGIYHHGIMIGSVQQYQPEEDDKVRIRIFIEPAFRHLVKAGSRFWNASGLTISGGVADLKLHLQSLTSLLKGGIVVETPAALKDSPQAANGRTFPLYKDFDAAAYGLPLTLRLTSGQGISEGSTQVVYQGMKVGVVKSISLNRDARHTVSAHVLLDPRAESILRSGTRFYMVRPGISLQGVRNLENLITGAYISFKPGDGDRQDHFVVNEDDDLYQTPPGTRFWLTADDAGSLSVGAPVFLKRCQVGEVTNIALSGDADHVRIGALIYERYAKHVFSTSRFYQLSGVEVDANLSGIKVQTGSLKSIISGGLAFYTPKKGAAATPKTRFTLYRDHDAAMDSDRVSITIAFDQFEGIHIGTVVKYQGARIGRVTALTYGREYKNATAKAMLEPQTTGLLREGTQFWLVRPAFSLTGGGNVDALLQGVFIDMTAGRGKTRRDFKALAVPPPAPMPKTGLNIVLDADDLSSLKPGSPVYYRRVVVGEVTGCRLSPTFQQVYVNVNIHEPYTPIIRENTRFWNASGIQIRGGVFSGISMTTESVRSILAGGVSLATPDKDKMGATVNNGHHFALHREAEDEWLTWRPSIGAGKP